MRRKTECDDRAVSIVVSYVTNIMISIIIIMTITILASHIIGGMESSVAETRASNINGKVLQDLNSMDRIGPGLYNIHLPYHGNSYSVEVGNSSIVYDERGNRIFGGHTLETQHNLNKAINGTLVLTPGTNTIKVTENEIKEAR